MGGKGIMYDREYRGRQLCKNCGDRKYCCLREEVKEEGIKGMIGCETWYINNPNGEDYDSEPIFKETADGNNAKTP
jgi:hypothetical protein